jgi:hypothetical protein
MNYEKLFKLFLELPDIAMYYPSLDDMINLIYKVINSTSTTSQKKVPRLSTVEVYQSVIDVISMRLLPKLKIIINNESSIFKINANNIRDHPKSLVQSIMLFLAHCDGDDTNYNLIDKIECIREFEKIVNQIKNSGDIVGGVSALHIECQRDEWMGWQGKCSLSWLMTGNWIEVNPLRSQYDTLQEYSETMLRMWVLLTFYWAAGAIWPKCLHKKMGNGGNNDVGCCGEPLLTLCHKSLNPIPCRSSGCKNNATWKCHRHGHDHVCSACLTRHQNKLIGSPSRESSTDIYDACIDRESVRAESTVYSVSKLLSRKPPTIEPNWNTTYRLNSAALVCIVPLSVRGEILAVDSTIYWAEIVPTDYDVIESQQRKQGKLSFRFLTKTDCSGLPEESDIQISPGTPIAIIDCRVFVPEVISILGTFSKPSFNAEMEGIAFADSFIGKHKARILDYDNDDNINEIIYEAISKSNISFINRLDETTKSSLATKISNLNVVKSLRGTQLDAFASALFNNLHCTQGM